MISENQDTYFLEQGAYDPDEVDTEEIAQYHGARLNDSPDTLGIHPFVDNSPCDELDSWFCMLIETRESIKFNVGKYPDHLMPIE